MFDFLETHAVGRPRPGRTIPLLGGLAGLLLAGGIAAQVPSRLAGWDTQRSQDLTYHLDVDMDCDVDDPTLFHERDVRKLFVHIGGGKIELTRTSSIESSSEHFGPYAFAADGAITLLADDPALPDDQKTPPLEATLLLRVWSGLPVTPQPGVTWSYLDPATAQLRVDKIEVQQKSLFTHVGTQVVGGGALFELDLSSELKLIDNLALSAMIGDPADRSVAAATAAAALSQDGNLFLYGSLIWETQGGASTGRTYSADLTYVAVPFSGGTRDRIANSVYRQHFVATLLP